jgi:NTE family protein
MQDSPPRRKVALALQGGGSHGAYTWGVLDRLLEDRTLDIIGVTGTSAGAMNAVVLADGLLRGGPEGARQQLRAFWTAIGRHGRAFQATPVPTFCCARKA